MFVTDCCVAQKAMSPESARDHLAVAEGTAGDHLVGNAVQQLRALSGLCNAGEFDAATTQLPLHERKINGDATDQAVLRFSESVGPVSELRLHWKKVFDMAFNSKNKFMIRVLTPVDQLGIEVALPAQQAAEFGQGDM